jgi:hypothetical protein
VETARKGARIDPQGYDPGRKISGKKRHILVDTTGLLMDAVGHPADGQERDGRLLLLVLAALFGLHTMMKKLFADACTKGRNSASNWQRSCPGCQWKW